MFIIDADEQDTLAPKIQEAEIVPEQPKKRGRPKGKKNKVKVVIEEPIFEQTSVQNAENAEQPQEETQWTYPKEGDPILGHVSLLHPWDKSPDYPFIRTACTIAHHRIFNTPTDHPFYEQQIDMFTNACCPFIHNLLGMRSEGEDAKPTRMKDLISLVFVFASIHTMNQQKEEN